MRKDGRAIRQLELGTGKYRAGRDPDADIFLESQHVSRTHFELLVSKGEVKVRDVGSRNGIRVDGRKVQATVLQPGQVVAVPHFEVEFGWLGPRERKQRQEARRKDTIGGGWDEYFETGLPPEREREDTGPIKVPLPAPQDANATSADLGPERSVLSRLAHQRSTGQRQPLFIDEDDEDDESASSLGSLLETLQRESNVLLFNRNEGEVNVEVIESLGGQVVRMELLAPGDSHWWGGDPGWRRPLVVASPDCFPVVTYLREGEYQVQYPENGRWKIRHRGERPLDVTKVGGMVRCGAEWDDQVAIQYGPYLINVRCVRRPPALPKVRDWRRFIPRPDTVLAVLLSCIIHTLFVGLPAPPKAVALHAIEPEGFAEVTYQVAAPPPEELEPLPPPVEPPPPPKVPPKVANVDKPQQARGTAQGDRRVRAPMSRRNEPPRSTARDEVTSAPDGGGPPDDSADERTRPPKPSVSVADFKVQGMIGHLPELRLADDGGGGGRAVFRGKRVKGYVGKNHGGMDVTPYGALDREVVAKVVNQNNREVSACYLKILENSPNAQGSIELTWMVQADGSVTAVRAVRDDVGSATLLRCIKQAVKEWRFPPPKSAPARVSFPFTFQPPRL